MSTDNRPRLFTTKQNELGVCEVLAAVMRSMPEFTARVLGTLDFPGGSRSDVVCSLEQRVPGARADIALDMSWGDTEARVLVEVKNGDQKLTTPRWNAYLSALESDEGSRLLTLTNEIETRSQTHPTPPESVAQRIRALGDRVRHTSWTRIATEAHLLAREVDGDLQRTLLEDLVALIESDRSGGQPFTKLGPTWKTYVAGRQLKDEQVEKALVQWGQLVSFIALAAKRDGLGPLEVRGATPDLRGDEEDIATMFAERSVMGAWEREGHALRAILNVDRTDMEIRGQIAMPKGRSAADRLEALKALEQPSKVEAWADGVKVPSDLGDWEGGRPETAELRRHYPSIDLADPSGHHRKKGFAYVFRQRVERFIEDVWVPALQG